MEGKKVVVGLVAVALLSATAVTASASWWGRGAWCWGPGGVTQGQVLDPALEKLRGELNAKDVEIQRELDVQKPDPDRLAVLEKEAIDIQVKIAKAGDGTGPTPRGYDGRYAGNQPSRWRGCGCW